MKSFVLIALTFVSVLVVLSLVSGASVYTFNGDASGILYPVALHGNPAFVKENVGNSALSFDGADDYISVALISEPLEQLTVAGWFNTRAFWSGTNEITGTWISKRNEYILSPNTDGSVTFYIYTHERWDAAASAPHMIQLNTWEHWVGTYDGRFIRLYRNGVLVAEKLAFAQDIPILPSIGRICVGADCGIANRFFNGKVDEMLIDNRAFSGSEVSSLFRIQRTAFIPERAVPSGTNRLPRPALPGFWR